MRKKILCTVVILVSCFNILGGSKVMAAGGCGNWYVASVGSPYCTSAGDCGNYPPQYLPNKPYNLQSLTEKRTCVSPNNEITYEVRFVTKTLGCC